MIETKIINLLGCPCSGKSTTAAGLFHLMKLEGYNVELVQEFVKKEVYAENKGSLADQLLLTASQNHLLRNLVGKVEYVICDASLLNGIVLMSFILQPAHK